MNTFTCHDCGATKPIQTNGGTGYGTYKEGGNEAKVCYACCAVRDKAEMTSTGKTVLYVTEESSQYGPTGKKLVVSNWPGTLRLSVHEFRRSDHNLAGRNGRLDVWFTGPDGREWHGVNIGDNQILRCKRLKK